MWSNSIRHVLEENIHAAQSPKCEVIMHTCTLTKLGYECIERLERQREKKEKREGESTKTVHEWKWIDNKRISSVRKTSSYLSISSKLYYSQNSVTLTDLKSCPCTALRASTAASPKAFWNIRTVARIAGERKCKLSTSLIKGCCHGRQLKALGKITYFQDSNFIVIFQNNLRTNTLRLFLLGLFYVETQMSRIRLKNTTAWKH